jgi:hypothetical protein
MTSEGKGFQVAARGWWHEAWCGGYYPDDLPEDWRLAYYGNEFRAVVVPAAYWLTVDALEVERWAEDVHDNFTFYLEVADLLTDWERFAAMLKPLQGRIGGVLLRPAMLDADLSLLIPALEGAAQLGPLSLLMPAGVEPNAVGCSLLQEYDVGLCWTVEQDEPRWQYGPLAVAWASGNLAYTPRQWREIIERCLREAGERALLVVVDGEPPDVEALRAAQMIGDMLDLPGSANA